VKEDDYYEKVVNIGIDFGNGLNGQRSRGGFLR
jgi:hypothetical protein